MRWRRDKDEEETVDSLDYEEEDYDEDDEDYEDYDEDDAYDEEDDGSGRSLQRTVIYMLSVLVVSLLLAIFGWFAADDVLALTKPDNVVTITVADGDSFSDVVDKLHENGLVKYKLLFKLYGAFSHAQEDIHPGTFQLNQQFDYHALVNGMADTSDTRMTVTLTFPEGYSCQQIFDMMAQNQVCDLLDLQDTAANYEFDYDFLKDLPYGDKNRLEGFLFPDTYEFYIDDDPVRVINRLLGTFDDKVTDEMLAAIDERNQDIRRRMEEEGSFSQEEIDGKMMDVYKVVTLASLIEKEAGSDAERATISSVIYNRLTTRVHELLQIDATVEYALGEHRTEITNEDLKVDSPYNTYLYEGLPPGPIANPGLASIMAAIYPKDTNYFFYALNADTGDHEFFETYIEQQEYLGGEYNPEEAGAALTTPEPNPEPSPEAETEGEAGEEPPEDEENDDEEE